MGSLYLLIQKPCVQKLMDILNDDLIYADIEEKYLFKWIRYV